MHAPWAARTFALENKKAFTDFVIEIVTETTREAELRHGGERIRRNHPLPRRLSAESTSHRKDARLKHQRYLYLQRLPVIGAWAKTTTLAHLFFMSLMQIDLGLESVVPQGSNGDCGYGVGG
ncbi:MAG: hypothetical protein WB662_16830, partial [Methyloceanibacter sp.]